MNFLLLRPEKAFRVRNCTFTSRSSRRVLGLSDFQMQKELFFHIKHARKHARRAGEQKKRKKKKG
jgi:hypothetical protein